MVDRRDIGSWLSGPPVDIEEGHYPGRDLGLPETGPGSVATFGRRLIALFLDGIIAQLIAIAFFGYRHGEGGLGVFLPTLVFLGMHAIMIATGGYTVGHRLLRLRVVRLDGGWAGPVPALVRTLMFALFIPVLIHDKDQRGLHDKAAGTVLVRA
ncbi:MAG: RDD family protein [Mobilicoccus sp.]|nr:RDD family protein [Mobilicoccus sp.]